MKKLLIISFLSLYMPALALCPIGNESVCTLPNNSGINTHIFQNNAKIGIGSNEVNNTLNMNSIQTPQPGSLNSSFSKTQNQEGIRMQGSLGCQFGNCNQQGSSSDFLQNQ